MSANVEFVTPPLGLEPLTGFDLDEIENAGGSLFSLRASNDQDIRLFVVPGDVMPTYQPVLTDEQVADLGLESADDAVVFAIVNPANGSATVNLLAPIVVNSKTGVAAQIILDGDWPVRQPLSEAI